MLRLKFTRRKKIIVLLIFSAGLYYFSTCLPDPLFETPVSTVLLDANKQLLGAYIASDGQWRFPENNDVSEKFAKAIICFEDKRFYSHPGVDLLATCRALWYNIKAMKVKSGGSTISMQVIRLSRKGRQRNVFEKAVEMMMAMRMEFTFSKKEILGMYASNAPFGGNVVGLDAASWRYFGKNQNNLSWSEAATLAVMPNSPSYARPGKNAERLLFKRNKLLDKLFESGVIDSTTCMLAKTETLPAKPYPLPQLAPHLLTRASVNRDNLHGTSVVHSTLNRELQIQANRIVASHHEILKGNGINNAAAIIADVETGNVLAYVGNVFEPGNPEINADVDIITAPRSTGSILKPFLFSAMLSEGEILPGTLVPDIPTQIAGYSPQNFSRTYDGAIPAKRALERSLNVPSVRMLRSYGLGKFNVVLKKCGMTTLTFPADHYGLSIILGGAEGSLWDIAGMYASLVRTLNHFSGFSGKYDPEDIHPLKFTTIDAAKPRTDIMAMNSSAVISASAIWCMLNAMEEVSRPEQESNWKEFSSSQRIAWKTGTSFGFRDGWAVGCTKKYVVAVWTGNADGEGRPGLIGVSTAAPIMFNLFNLLKNSSWFEQPYDEMEKIAVCHLSGYRSSDICKNVDSVWIPRAGLRTPPCPYHRVIHLDHTGRWRVSSDCESTTNMIHKSWFVLPPAQEWYYKSKNHSYATLPPFRKDCDNTDKSSVMEFIYPKKSTMIYVPIELDGKTGKTIFEIAHRNPGMTIFWHLDDAYMGSTKDIHQVALSPAAGKHTITVVDEQGERLEQHFEILGPN